jgi:shikimate dehydrogenase
MSSTLDLLQPHVSNRLAADDGEWITGIIGDRPSQYAKTPPLWNAVFGHFSWPARSLPFDLTDEALAPFMTAAREAATLLGFSVTQPFKLRVLEHLDVVDPLAASIGAVNTVRRDRDGRLTGYNTDGQGAIDALTRALPGMPAPFMPTLQGQRVLLIGAGGAARAVAFYLASAVGPSGALWIVNRDPDKARILASGVREATGIGSAEAEADIPRLVADSTLVVNASVKGQAGWRSSVSGVFSLEPYSAFAAARPVVIAADADESARWQAWHAATREDLIANLAASHRVVDTLPRSAACFDLVYAPLETPFLRHARFSGHRTLNGKWMNVAQAADAFANKVCADICGANGIASAESYARAFEVMARVW